MFYITLLLISQIFDPSATGYTFMKIGVGVRPVAMGNAFSALSDDENAVFWNPAGLGMVNTYHLAGMFMNHVTYLNYYNLTSAIPADVVGTVGIGISYLGASDTEYSERGENLGDFTNSDMLLNIGYGRSFGKHNVISVGGAVKVVRSQLYSFSSYGLLLDAGLIYNPVKYLYLGTVLKNVGTRRRFIDMWEYPPVNFRQGVAIKLPISANQLALSCEYSYFPDSKSTFSVGGEIVIRDPRILGSSSGRRISGFAIMGGYQYGYGEGAFSGFSAGFSLEIVVSPGIYLDVSALLLSYGYLGTSERIALGLNYVPIRGRASR
jgi:hypothetical protein